VEKKTRNSKEKTINIIKNLEKKKIEVSYRVTAKKITAFKNRFFISRKKKIKELILLNKHKTIHIRY
jgi:hypothetical protein